MANYFILVVIFVSLFPVPGKSGAFDCNLPTPGNVSNIVCSTCEERCGGILEHVRYASCSCDILCGVYDDCCQDVDTACPGEYELIEQYKSAYGSSKTSCFPIKTRNWYGDIETGLYRFIAFCHMDRLACTYSLSMENLAILHYGGPVQDTTTGLNYINAACALCNNVTENTIRPHPVTFSCTGFPLIHDGDEVPVEETTLDAETVLQTVNQNEFCAFVFDSDIKDILRPCIASQTTCDNSCATHGVSSCSDSKMNLVASIENRWVAYKNIYCALCNGIQSNSIICYQGSGASDGTESIGIEAFSLALMFDISTSGAQLSSLSVQCVMPNQWLEYGLRCSDFICPTGYFHDGGQLCKENNTYNEVIVEFNYDFSITYKEPCPLMDMLKPRSLSSHIQTAFRWMDNDTCDCGFMNIDVNISNIINHTTLYRVIVAVNMTNETGRVEDLTQQLREAGYTSMMDILNDIVENCSSYQLKINFTAYGDSVVLITNSLNTVCKGYISQHSEFRLVNDVLITNDSLEFGPQDYVLHDGSAIICRVNSSISHLSSGLGMVTICTSVLSFICLCTRLLLQICYKPYHTIPGKMQFQLTLSLAMSNLLLLITPLCAEIDLLCTISGGIKQFSYLSSFAWMTCVSVDTWRALHPNNMSTTSNSKALRKYRTAVVVAWLPPALWSTSVTILDFTTVPLRVRPGFGPPACWFINKLAMIVFFVVPIGCLIITNLFVFFLTSVNLKKAFENARDIRAISNPLYSFRVYTKTFLLMGMTWSLLFVAIWLGSEVFWYIFIVINATQGVYLLFAFGPDMKWWKLAIGRCCSDRSTHYSHSSTAQSTTPSRETLSTDMWPHIVVVQGWF